MKAELQLLFNTLKELQLEIHQVLETIPQRVSAESIPDLIDSGFLCRELANVVDDIRNRCENRQAIISRFLAATASVAALKGESMDLRGELAIAVPDITVKPNLPKNDSPEMIKLLIWLGVPEDIARSGTVRPSFTKIEELLTKREAAGQKPPPGIMSKWTDAKVVFRRRTNNDKQEF